MLSHIVFQTENLTSSGPGQCPRRQLLWTGPTHTPHPLSTAEPCGPRYRAQAQGTPELDPWEAVPQPGSQEALLLQSNHLSPWEEGNMDPSCDQLKPVSVTLSKGSLGLSLEMRSPCLLSWWVSLEGLYRKNKLFVPSIYTLRRTLQIPDVWYFSSLYTKHSSFLSRCWLGAL